MTGLGWRFTELNVLPFPPFILNLTQPRWTSANAVPEVLRGYQLHPLLLEGFDSQKRIPGAADEHRATGLVEEPLARSRDVSKSIIMFRDHRRGMQLKGGSAIW